MPRTANAQLKRLGPLKHEWLFADRKLLPDEEVEAAYFWEFGLESPDVIAEVEAIRKRQTLSEKVDREAVSKWYSANPSPGVGDTKQLTEWSNRFREQFPDYLVTTEFRNSDVHFLFNWPEFPSQHWLQIPERMRNQVDEKRFRPRPGQLVWGQGLKGKEVRGSFGTVAAVFFKTESGLGCRQYNFWEAGQGIGHLFNYVPTTKTPYGAANEDRWTEYRLVSFSWARSDRKLKADFSECLKENRPDHRKAYHKSKDSDSRRTTHRDLLKSLGALRLLRHFKGDWEAAADYSALLCKDKRGNPKPLYVEQSEWREAGKRAKEALSNFSKKVFG